MTSTRTYILAHGSFHGPWCWDLLVACLEPKSQIVNADFSAGEFDDHVRDLAALIGSVDAANTILVLHSYAGMVGADAIDASGVQPAQTVFLDAFLPLAGESAFDILRAADVILPQSADGMLIPPDAETLLDARGGERADWLRARLRPFPAATHAEQSRHDASRLSNATYIRCTKFPLFAAAEMRAADAGWPVMHLAAPHDAMLSHPVMLGRMLEAVGQ